MAKPKSQYAPGKHPNSLRALKEHGFKPGQSGNPKGGPNREHSITKKQREMLPLPCPYSTKGQTWLEWLAERGMALAGENPTYYKELLDRLEGKVVQPIEGQVDSDIVFIIGKGYANDKPDIQTNQQDTE